MVHWPPILLMDEPTAGVDIKLRQQLWDYVKSLNDQVVTVMLTTNYLEEAEDKLREGVGLSRLLKDGPPLAANIDLARFLLRHNQADSAFDVAREVVDSATSPRGQVPGFLLLARARIGQGDPEGARFEVATVQGTLMSDPTAPVAYRLEAASILRDLGDLPGALAHLRLPGRDQRYQ